jgi:hypothetical protein
MWNSLSPELILSPSTGLVNTFTKTSASFYPHENPVRPSQRHVYVGMATHGTDRQTGINIAEKVVDIEGKRGQPETKNVSICTDGAPNMNSDAVGAAETLVKRSHGAVKCFFLFIVFILFYFIYYHFFFYFSTCRFSPLFLFSFLFLF